MSVVKIRVFQFPEDYPQVRELWENAGPGLGIGRSDTPEEIAKKSQHDPDLFLIAELDGRVVGTVIGGFDGRRGMVYHLAVEDGLRHQGIGQQLMDELETRLRARGCLKYYLLVKPDNSDAMHFYEQRGWKRMDLAIYGKEL
jgi:ribosomal protein S18 acetylase RimI-like enzyme